MCLQTYWRLPRITLKPIMAYKVVQISSSHELVAPCRKPYRYDTDGLNSCPLFPIKGERCTFIGYVQNIEEGYFHLWKDKDTAETMVFVSNYDKSYIIKKCIIPRFTLYYKGINGDIAAKKFKFID